MSFLFMDGGGDHWNAATVLAKYSLGNATTAPGGPHGDNKFITSNLRKILTAASGPTAIIGRWFKPTSLASGSDLIRIIHNATTQAKLILNTSGTLSVVRGAATVLGTSTAVLSVGTWYFLEIEILIDDVDGAARVWITPLGDVDSTLVLSLTGVNTQADTAVVWNGFGLGDAAGDFGPGYVLDAIGPSRNEAMGPTRIETLIAEAGNGTHVGWTPSSGVDHGAMVDEPTPNGDTDYNFTSAVGKDSYHFPSIVGVGRIRGIQVLGYMRKVDAAMAQGQLFIRRGTTDSLLTIEDVGQDYVYLRGIFPTNPANNSPWTPTAIAALQAGGYFPTQSAPTKFYLQNRAAPYTPATLRGAWDKTSDVITKALDPQKQGGGINDSNASNETNAAAGFDVLLYRGVSGPLAAQTIAGTVNVCIAVTEGDPSADFHWHLHLYVTQGNSDTPRGTLLTDYTEALGVNEFPSSPTFHALNAAAALSGVSPLAGDRLVAEIGYVARNATADLKNASMRFGTIDAVNQPLPDGTVGSTDHDDLAGFLQFSAGIVMAGTLRLSHMVIEVLSELRPAPVNGTIGPIAWVNFPRRVP